MRTLPAKNDGVIVERIRVTAQMREQAYKRILRGTPVTERVVWRWWEISQSEFHRREVGEVDLGEIS